MADFTEWPAWLHTNSWAGHLKQAIVVVGETQRSYRIRGAREDRVRLAGARRFLEPGSVASVPKHAVTKRRDR